LYTESDLWEISIKIYRLEKNPGISKRVDFYLVTVGYLREYSDPKADNRFEEVTERGKDEVFFGQANEGIYFHSLVNRALDGVKW
jgi:hypothetical protein